LERFRGDETRIILLATWIYDNNLRASLHPECLGDALERDPVLDRIWRAPELGEKYQRIFLVERAELLNGDIPYFHTRVDGDVMISGRGDRFERFFARSGYEAVTERIAFFSDADLERQLWFIRAAFATIPLGKAESTWRSYGGKRTASDTTTPPLLSMAEAIGRRLVKLAIESGDHAGWLGVSLVNGREWRLVPASGDLYNGVSGIALFLAYLARFTRDPVYRRVARAALATALEYVAAVETVADQVGSVAPFMGSVSGTIFLLTHLADLWRDGRISIGPPCPLSYPSRSFRARSRSTLRGSPGPPRGPQRRCCRLPLAEPASDDRPDDGPFARELRYRARPASRLACDRRRALPHHRC
jgi:lantibiotic modifying enzyme